MFERRISLNDLKEAANNGWHEHRKDSFDMNWKYSIRGTGGRENEIRFIVSLKEKMIIITAISLDKEE